NVPAAALPHPRQHSAGHAGEAEEVDLEHPSDVSLVALLYGGEVADPGVVHQHVDTTEGLFGTPHGLGDLRRVSPVEPQGQGAVLVAGDDVRDLFGVTGRHHCAEAASHHGAGQFAAKTGRTARDEPNRRLLQAHSDLLLSQLRECNKVVSPSMGYRSI